MMRLIVGNIYQGREAFARKKYGDSSQIIRLEWNNFEKYIKNKIETENSEDIIIVADEPYQGLTPIDADRRKAMEEYGQLLQSLAQQAESVERVVCGLGITLK